MMVDRNLTQDDVHSFLLNAYFGEVADPVFTAAGNAYLDYQCRLRSAILSSKGLAPLLWEFRNRNR